MKKIEIVTWFSCNTRCWFCSSPSMAGRGFTTDEILVLLDKYREDGYREVDFGGGEPSVREDLPEIASAAKRMGYERIGLKTNGIRLCYPGYIELCMKSGINNFSISLWGHDPETHDLMARRNGAFEASEMALKHLVDFDADVVVDYLITTLTLNKLDFAFEKLLKIGTRKIRLWLFSIFGSGGLRKELLPKMVEAGGAVAAVFESYRSEMEYMGTSHIMPCVLKGRHEIYFNAAELNLLVITPGNTFRAEDSPFESGVNVDGCFDCTYNKKCAGPRPEYIEINGESEFKPIAVDDEKTIV